VVYVDYDPVVVLHSQAKRRVPGTAAVRADVRSPEVIFASPVVKELIDFDQPCGVLMMSVLHFVRPRIPRRAFGCSARPAASCRRLDWFSARGRR